ncbi:hypothetical protein [Calothrix sp. PCC 6303]|uniref:hypothetical protein n=1 Tax=Calothrix sp. PCC 6303 TaxID=1170562 RepID=UPI0002A00783|nr:hypothetical protein [Calothrix sp. PCC 6303]AFZ02996.1 hypothetical protein Cal6303_4080 [Calothrix sp. PCC 6303]
MPKICKMFPSKSIILFLGMGLAQFHPVLIPTSQAQIVTAQKLSEAPLDLKFLNSPNPPSGVLTSRTINQNGLTAPSLWWIKENFEKKLMDNWIAYPQLKRVDVVVNQQFWSIFDYLERYNFINRVGANAKNFGYSTRVFNYQEELLGTYTCNFQIADNRTKTVNQTNSFEPVDCRIKMNSENRLGVEPIETEK